ncbi:MAG: hypothetical protein O7C75_01720 [Verrucomicrobia bacterium]|nr:hypothetical protein [Verrucomicrobiota bacterium]
MKIDIHHKQFVNVMGCDQPNKIDADNIKKSAAPEWQAASQLELTTVGGGQPVNGVHRLVMPLWLMPF